MKLKSTEKRKIIENFFAEENFDGISEISGIVVEQRRNRSRIKEDCIDYVNHFFPDIDLSDFDWGRVPEGYIEILRPEKGSLVVYYFRKNLAMHIGILRGKDEVISKWDGNGHVYSHNIEAVPLQYGNVVKFYKKL